MAKGKQAAENFRGDGKVRSHRGRKYWTSEELQGHEAYQKDRDARAEKKKERKS